MSTMRMASPTASWKSPTERSTATPPSVTVCSVRPAGSRCCRAAMTGFRCLLRSMTSPPACMVTPMPSTGSAFVAHLLVRRILVAGIDARDVAQPEQAAVGPETHLLQACDGMELAAAAQTDVVAAGLEAAGRHHRVLGLQYRDDVLGAKPQCRELAVGYLHVDHLGLFPEVIHLGHVRHPQQHLAQRYRRSPSVPRRCSRPLPGHRCWCRRRRTRR